MQNYLLLEAMGQSMWEDSLHLLQRNAVMVTLVLLTVPGLGRQRANCNTLKSDSVLHAGTLSQHKHLFTDSQKDQHSKARQELWHQRITAIEFSSLPELVHNRCVSQALCPVLYGSI